MRAHVVAELVRERVVAGGTCAPNDGKPQARVGRRDRRRQVADAARGVVFNKHHDFVGAIGIAPRRDIGDAAVGQRGERIVEIGFRVGHLRLVHQPHPLGDAAVHVGLVGHGDGQVGLRRYRGGAAGCDDGALRVDDHHVDQAAGVGGNVGGDRDVGRRGRGAGHGHRRVRGRQQMLRDLGDPQRAVGLPAYRIGAARERHAAHDHVALLHQHRVAEFHARQPDEERGAAARDGLGMQHFRVELDPREQVEVEVGQAGIIVGFRRQSRDQREVGPDRARADVGAILHVGRPGDRQRAAEEAGRGRRRRGRDRGPEECRDATKGDDTQRAQVGKHGCSVMDGYECPSGR